MLEPEFVRLDVGEVTLRVARAGPVDGPLVILLHGFPEGWYGWRHQVGPLAEAGYRVLAPDQRGYGGSDKPEPVAAYALDRLARDAASLVVAEGRDRAGLVGHDWGGVVAWWCATVHADRFERVAVLNAPHPLAYRPFRKPRQLVKSWYAFAFQLPWLPESTLRRDRWRGLVDSMRSTSRPGTFSEADFDRYRADWDQPGAIRAMINWYRAGLRHPPARPSDPHIRLPIRVLWGLRDRFLVPEQAEAGLGYCHQGRLHQFEDATHWLQHEVPEAVNRLLLEFLAGSHFAAEPGLL